MIHHYLAARAELDAPGSPFATTTEVVRGVPLKVFAACPPDMRVVWEMSAAHGPKDYLVYEDERYTYDEVHAQVRKLAAHLVANGV
ncbi:MAG TPA: AMP-dependent synthetase, partial [Ilumatobacteraceae bacterium]|nr:AMP-dependent synthetase [Ilumatobacteraceae bacterium]